MEEHIQSVTALRYFGLSEATDESARLDKDFAARLDQCTKCLTYKAPWEKIPVMLRYVPSGLSITFVWDTNLTLVSKDFLKVLNDALVAESGNLFQTFPVEVAGKKCLNYVGFRPRYFTTVRGSERVFHFDCPECGNVGYVAFGRRYLVEPIDRSVPLFSAGEGWVVVRGDIMQSMRLTDPNLVVEELTIEQSPYDGLPADLRVSKK